MSYHARMSRTVQQIIRVTPEEKEAFAVAAERSGLTLAAWWVQAARVAAGMPAFDASEVRRRKNGS